MSGRSKTAAIKDLVEPVVSREGFELVDLELVFEQGRQVLRLYIDTVPPGTKGHGVSVDDCGEVSRVVGDLLDVEDAVDGPYTLEVSSPGLFRPLTKGVHFDRAVGERVKVKTYEKVGDRRVFIGTLLRREGDRIALNVDGTEHILALEKVAKANLEPEL